MTPKPPERDGTVQMPTREWANRGRRIRIGSYLCLVAAGALLPIQIATIPNIVETLWWVLCVWLILGGVICLVGAFARRWIGEFVGLPLLASAMGGFGLLTGQHSSWAVTAAPSVGLLWGFALLLFARWRDVEALYRAARRAVDA